MNTRVLELVAFGIRSKRGSVRLAPENDNRDGVIIRTPSSLGGEQKSALDRFIRDCKKGRPNPLHRSPDTSKAWVEWEDC